MLNVYQGLCFACLKMLNRSDAFVLYINYNSFACFPFFFCSCLKFKVQIWNPAVLIISHPVYTVPQIIFEAFEAPG